MAGPSSGVKRKRQAKKAKRKRKRGSGTGSKTADEFWSGGMPTRRKK